MVHLSWRTCRPLIYFCFSLLFLSAPALAQLGKPAARKKPKAKPAAAKETKPESAAPKAAADAATIKAWINAGLAYNLASGDFFRQQEAFYQTGSDSFPGQMEQTNRMSFTAGAHALYRPFATQTGFLSHLSVWAGIQYLNKGFDTQFTMANLEVPYTDQTIFSEQFRATYLAPSIGLRLGNKYYADLGLSYDLLLSGSWKRTITHKASEPADGIIGGNYQTEVTDIDQNLDSNVLKAGSPGFVAGLGAWFHPRIGARLGLQSNPRFFKSGADVQNLQFNFQVLISLL